MIHDGYAKFKWFPGAKISHLDHYSEPTLTEDKPDYDKNSNDQIADDIIKIGKSVFSMGSRRCLY